MNKKAIFLLTIFVNLAVLSGLVFGLGFHVDQEDYPPNSTGIQDENVNYTLAQSSLIGDGDFDSLTGAVDDTMYAVWGTYSETAWDGYIPEYDYGATDIQLTPQYFSKIQTHGTSRSVSDSWGTHSASGGDHYNDYTLDFKSWYMELDDDGSHAIDVNDDFEDKDCGSPDENYGDSPSACDDGDWYGNSVSSVAVGGGRQDCYTNIWGDKKWTKIYVKIYVAIDFPVDPNWILDEMDIVIGMGSTHDSAQDDAIFAAYGSSSADAALRIDTYHGNYYLGSDYEGSSRTEWDDALGGSDSDWTFVRQNNRRFARQKFTYDVADNSIYWYKPGNHGAGVVKFEFRAYASTTAGSTLVEVQCIPTEFDVNFHLRWAEGSGWFRGTSGKTIVEAQYWDGSTYSSSSTADSELGHLKLAEDYAERNNGDIRVKGITDGDIKDIDLKFDYSSNTWADTEWGAIQSDVTLEFWEGTSWVQLGSVDWSIDTPNLNTEDWYVPTEGIKWKFQASSYSSLPGINGVSWSYTIDYHSINFTESIDTEEGSGTHDFMQSSGRIIDETWDEIRFYKTPYLDSLSIGITEITKLTQEFVSFHENTPLYNCNSSDFSPLLWLGDQANSITAFWDFNNQIPSINNYSIVDKTVEYKPTRFNISSDEANYSHVVLGKLGEAQNGTKKITVNENGEIGEWKYGIWGLGPTTYQRLEYLDSLWIRDYKNTTHDGNGNRDIYNFTTFDIGAGNITQIDVNIFGHFQDVSSAGGGNFSLNLGDSWTENVSMNFGINTPSWSNHTFNNVNLNQSVLDNMQIMLNVNNLTYPPITQLLINYVELNLTYTNQSIEYEVFELDQFDGTYYYNDISSLSEGNYTYYYLVQNEAGNWRTTDEHELNVRQGEINVSFVQVDYYPLGDVGNKLIWNVNDSLGGDWWVKINGFEVYSGTWNAPNERFERSLDGYPIGVHDITIFANNTIGREGYNSTKFVVYQAPVFVAYPGNTSLGECTDDSYTVGWSAIDDNPRNYTLTHNDTVVQSGTWDSLHFVYYTVNTCKLEQNATHVYRMEFQDQHNISTVVYLTLFIFPISPIISNELGGFMYEDDDVQVIWEVSDDCLANYTLEYLDSLYGWQLYYKANLSYGISPQGASVIIDGDDFLPHGGTTEVLFRCTVYDWNNNSAFDEINVTVVPNPPILEDHDDGYYFGDDPEAELVWTVQDNNFHSYWIEISEKDKDDFEKVVEKSLLKKKGEEIDITLNLFKLELDAGEYELVIYVMDTYGNIVNDTVALENRGEEAGVEINPQGLVAWLIVIGVALFGVYAITQSDQWDRYDQTRKTQVVGGTIAIVAIILIVLSIFGIFPVVFVQLEDFSQNIEQSLGEYGILILVLGVSGGTVGGILLIYYILRRRKEGTI